jgi:hypothetical protein
MSSRDRTRTHSPGCRLRVISGVRRPSGMFPVALGKGHAQQGNEEAFKILLKRGILLTPVRTRYRPTAVSAPHRIRHSPTFPEKKSSRYCRGSHQ